jgi:hypothetical protein
MIRVTLLICTNNTSIMYALSSEMNICLQGIYIDELDLGYCIDMYTVGINTHISHIWCMNIIQYSLKGIKEMCPIVANI